MNEVRFGKPIVFILYLLKLQGRVQLDKKRFNSFYQPPSPPPQKKINNTAQRKIINRDCATARPVTADSFSRFFSVHLILRQRIPVSLFYFLCVPRQGVTIFSGLQRGRQIFMSFKKLSYPPPLSPVIRHELGYSLYKCRWAEPAGLLRWLLGIPPLLSQK